MKFISIIIISLNVFVAKASDLERAEVLIKKYKVNDQRPKSCPLESIALTDLMAKTEIVKNIFKSNCLSKDDGKVTDVLNSVNDIQDELKKRSLIDSTIVGQTILSSKTDAQANMVSGLKMSSLFKNITAVIKQNQCNLDDGRFLETIADVLNNSTQLGLLSGNDLGIMVAGGGFVLSSALRLINIILKKKFNFNKNQSRQTFIKLNCSFYDIRKDMQNYGILDIDTNEKNEELKKIKELISNLSAEITIINKTLESIDQAKFIESSGDVSALKKELVKIKFYLLAANTETLELPNETQKLLIITKISDSYDLLEILLNEYNKLRISTAPIFDNLFLLELKKYDQKDPETLSQLMNLNAKDFNEVYKAKLVFHVLRILNDITSREEVVSGKKSNVENEKILNIQKRKELYSDKISALNKIEVHLERIVSFKEYSGNDNGADNLISILENYKEISDDIYGEWGAEFLEHIAKNSFKEIKNFKGKLKHYKNKYKKNEKAKNNFSLYECQDLQRMRSSYKYASSMAQEGYGFIITNKDLFYTDGKNFLGFALDEEEYDGPSDLKAIQRHYKSTILALRQMKNEKTDKDDESKYLSVSMTGKTYLGKTMIEISALKEIVKNLQNNFEHLNCNNELLDDLN